MEQKLSDKYTTTQMVESFPFGSKERKDEEMKIVISNDAYAMAETFQKLAETFAAKLEHLRLSVIK